MKKHPPSAFSLIEVVVALGLFSFCIVGILALFAVAVGSARSVGDESNAVHVASSIAGIWEVAPLGSNVELKDSDATVDMGTFSLGADSQELYYDGDGKMTSGAPGASLKLEYEAAPLANNPNAFEVNMIFTWPANAATNSAALNRRTYQYIFSK